MNQYGGLIYDIPPEKLFSEKPKYSIPLKLKKYTKLITIPNSNVVRVGSSIAKIQPYFSDVDIMNIVDSTETPARAVDNFIVNLKNIVKQLLSLESSNIFFSDFKAGDKHWTAEQILNESNGSLSLHDACLMKDVIKIDMFAPYDGRYLEMSTFFILKSNETYINVDEHYFDNLQKSLLEDIKTYKDTKPFKAVKRVWSYAKIKKDAKTLKKLENLIKSNIALLSQINADIETIEMMIERKNNYDKDFLLIEVDDFKERLSNIIDIPFDELKVDIMIDNILLLIMNNKDYENNEQLVDSLGLLHDYLLTIINKETLDYLNHINFTFPTCNNEGFLSKLFTF